VSKSAGGLIRGAASGKTALWAGAILVAALGCVLYFRLIHGTAQERLHRQTMSDIVKKAINRELSKAQQIRKGMGGPTGHSAAPEDFTPLVVATSPPAQTQKTLTVNLSRYPTTADILEMARGCPAVRLTSRSTAPFDERIADSMTAAPAAQARIKGLFKGDFAPFYRQVVEAPVVDFQLDHTVSHLEMAAVPGKGGRVPSRSPVTVLFASGDQVMTYHFFPLRQGDVLRNDAVKQVCSYIEHYAGQIDSAALILYRAHSPDVRLDNVRLFLRSDIIIHHLELTSEDIWQDRAAARWSGSSLYKNLHKQYREFTARGVSVGVELHGNIRDLPWWTWRLAALSRKYDPGRQGIGPQQIILGLAREAAGRPDILARYGPVLSKDDFSTGKACVRTALDPVKSIYTKTMIFDYIISSLKKGPFSNAGFRLPINTVPFINDLATAREYSLYLLAMRLSMFPENSELAAELLATTINPLYITLDYFGKVFGIEPQLPGLFYCCWSDPVQKRTVYSKFIF